MNEGTIALAALIGTIAASLYLAWHRALLFPPSPRGRAGGLPARRSRLANRVRARSARPNAEKPERSGVQTFTARSAPNAAEVLPASAAELHTLAHVIVLYARRPNKELAISDATGASKGAGEEYRRWAALFDAAMGDAARAAAKAKPPELAAKT